LLSQMDEFLADDTPVAAPVADSDDPFGMGPEPAADGAYEPPPPLSGDQGFGDMPTDMGGDMPSFGGDMGGGDMPSFGEEPAAPSFGGDIGGGEMPSFEAQAAEPPMFGGGGLGAEFSAPTEMGPLAKWRIAQQEKLAAKAEAAEAQVAERLTEAQAAIATFYAERTETVSKRATANRAAEAAYVEERDAAMIADSWESVCKLVDLKEKEAAVVDTSRMKQILVQLKHT